MPDTHTTDYGTLYNADNIEILKTMADNSIDAIVTDPPYAIKLMNKKWDNELPSVEFWTECLRILKPGGHLLSACGTRTYHRATMNIDNAGFEIRDVVAWIYGYSFPKSMDISQAINNELKNENDLSYKQWKGWKTTLKPCLELWTLARKPIAEKNIARNIIKYRTGGLNIDKCRIINDGKKPPIKISRSPQTHITLKNHKFIPGEVTKPNPNGRFPANVIHDGSNEAIAEFPGNGIYNASRFFYCAKPTEKERSSGLDKRNEHPTIKPIKLLEHFCNLITPPNGIVLDPFIGSGSTAIACIKCGFKYIGIEIEEEYFNIAKQRIEYELEQRRFL